MKRISIFLVAALFAGPALAQFSGPYAGINGGYGSGKTSYTRDVPDNFGPAGSTVTSTKGPIGGAHAGWNIRKGNFVAGVEVGATGYSGIKGSAKFPDKISGSTHSDFIASAKAKVGVVVGKTLLYATGGYAGAQMVTDQVNASGQDPITWTGRSWHNGYLVGAGAERMLTSNISVGAEYNYVSLAKGRASGKDSSGADAATASSANGHIGLLRLSFHF